jgi:hypothetical protein
MGKLLPAEKIGLFFASVVRKALVKPIFRGSVAPFVRSVIFAQMF